jgi:hypothetical protein
MNGRKQTTGFKIRSLFFFFLSGILILAFGAIIFGTPESTLGVMVNSLIFDKSATASGLERLALFRIGITVAYETFFLGAGLGSTRSNGFIALWLSSLGIIGLILFCRFVWLAYFPKKIKIYYKDEHFFPACAALSSIFAAALTSLTFPNLGLIFYICLAFCVAAGSAMRESRGGAR